MGGAGGITGATTGGGTTGGTTGGGTTGAATGGGTTGAVTGEIDGAGLPVELGQNGFCNQGPHFFLTYLAV